ncbi:hypothetical protein [Xylophilus sp. Leaf220]|uniref:hypothetical protein n=1 Tax=Xylophilus sp. Leaf220 TaxID=1735686 RepID=UPI0012E159B5|nr:hypothetical protein [Xylophilus sp. Leaf220]
MATNPEFPNIEDISEEDPADEVEIPRPGEGLIEPSNVPVDEEIERVIQPEPVGE